MRCEERFIFSPMRWQTPNKLESKRFLNIYLTISKGLLILASYANLDKNE